MTAQRGFNWPMFLSYTPGLVIVALIGLKVTGAIDLSWLWVLAGLWVPGAALVGLITLTAFLKAVLEPKLTHDQKSYRQARQEQARRDSGLSQ